MQPKILNHILDLLKRLYRDLHTALLRMRQFSRYLELIANNTNSYCWYIKKGPDRELHSGINGINVALY